METKRTQPKRSLSNLIKQHFWHIVIFFVIAISLGIFLADLESRSVANWQTFTSKEAALSFKHPNHFKIVEDHGWRITVYTSEHNTENNIKIVYMPKDQANQNSSMESQFLAQCQPTKVNEITAKNARIKVYEDSICGEQHIPYSIVVYSENGMTYDIGLFGKIDTSQLYQFLSGFEFNNTKTTPSIAPSLQFSPSPLPTIPSKTTEGKMCGGIASIQCTNGYSCQLDGTYPDASGRCVKNPPDLKDSCKTFVTMCDPSYTDPNGGCAPKNVCIEKP